MRLEQTILDTNHLYPRWEENPALDVVFQPLVHIPSGKTFGFEALSRPRLGPDPIPVSILLESASQFKKLSQFDRVALPVILKQASQLGLSADQKLFVNFSPFTLHDPDSIFAAMSAPGVHIDPAQLVIEISEREALPNIDLVELIAPYRSSGMGIALDDFGAGYSGLTRVVDIEPDIVKIDLGLVRDIDKNPVKFALVESTVQFATRSGHLEVLAEGIESQAELATLYELGVTLGQGYLLGRPTPHLTTATQPISLNRLTRRLPESSELLQAFITTTHRMIDGVGVGDGLASHVAHLAARLTAADQVAIWKLAGKELVADYAFPPLLQEFQRFPLNPGTPSYRALTERQTVVLQTPEECAESALAQSLGMQSILVVPVTDRFKTRALLTVAFARPSQIRPQEIQITEGLGRLMALVTTMPTVSDDFPGFGEPVFEAMASLMASGDLESLLAKVMEAALSVSGGHIGYIGVLTPDSLHAVTADGETFDIPKSDLYDPTTDVGAGPIGRSLRDRRMIVVQDVADDTTLDPWRNDLVADGIHAALAIPLMSSGGVLGLLKVYHSHKNGFELGRVRRLEALASLATVLIDKWQEEHYQSRRWMRQKTDVLVNLIKDLMTGSSAPSHLTRVEATVRSLLDGRLSGTIAFHEAIPTQFAEPPVVTPLLSKRILKVVDQARSARCVAIKRYGDDILFALPLVKSGVALGAIWIIHSRDGQPPQGPNTDLLTPHLAVLSLIGADSLLLD